MTRHYLDKMAMPMTEWICVTAIPLYLCNNKIETFQSFDEGTLLQWNLFVMGATALLSFISIFPLGEACNNKQKMRGEGLVIGSHLIPVMFYAMHLLSAGQENGDTNQSINAGMQHVIYSSCGGISFIISCLWSRTNRITESMTSKKHDGVMKLCWKVYLALLFSNHVVFSITQHSQCHLPCTVLGLIHIFMVYCYGSTIFNNRGDQKQWQDAFTCGEWMVVSNLAASLTGDFILLHFSSVSYNRDHFPEHVRIAHAGLVGCIVGIVYSQASSRILRLGIIGSLTSVIGVVIGFLELVCSRIPVSQIEWIALPRSVQWILQFLSDEVQVFIGGDERHICRYFILAYWSLVLIASIPLTIKLCSWVESDNILKKKRIVIARKFFHLIAIILFTPITWLDPDLIALAYAIATTLLMILEIIRCHSIEQKQSNVTLSLNAFYKIFLDEKDSHAAEGGLAITQITLIVGCSMPLWMSQIMNLNDNTLLVQFLPFIGVLVLGIGDSVGAIAGVNFGRHRWPGSTRTLEGSFSMYASMFVPLFLVYTSDCWEIGVVLAIVTLLEASTSQIDNLCLPLS